MVVFLPSCFSTYESLKLLKYYFKIGCRQKFIDLWYAFFHLAVLWPRGLKHTYFHGENSFWGFSDPSGGPLGPLFLFTPEMLDFAPGQRFCLLPARFWVKIFETFTRGPPGPP